MNMETSSPYEQSTMRSSFHLQGEDDPAAPIKEKAGRPWAKILLAAVLVSVLIFVVVDTLTEQRIARGFQNFLDWIGSNLVAGFFAFMGVYFLATICFMPGSVLSLGGGAVFGNAAGLGPGVLLATTAVFVGACSGAVVSFLLGRYLFRDWVEQTLARKYPVVKALDAAFQRKGFRIFLLMRLAPVLPSYNIINYIGGVTSMKLSDYTLALVGILPGTLLYCFIGASAGSLTSAEDSVRPLWIASVVVGVLLGMVALFLVGYYAKKEFDKIVAESEHQAHGSEEEVAPETPAAQKDVEIV